METEINDRPTGIDIIESFLPDQYRYKLLSCEVVEKGSLQFSDINFDLEVRVNISSEEEVYEFLKKLNISSSCTFNVKSGYPDKKPKGEKSRSLLRGFRKCCLNVKTSEGSKAQQEGKDTNCQGSLNFRLETPIAKKEKDKNEKQSFPLWLSIHFNHNHTISRAEYFRFLSVNKETETFFDDMFFKGNINVIILIGSGLSLSDPKSTHPKRQYLPHQNCRVLALQFILISH